MSEVCVRVAVRIRPLLRKELLHQHQVCVRVVPSGSGQVSLGSDRLFSFDHAFGPTASQDEVYESCVQPLVESLLDGYNATVFCYGQTGSGKTYTLGGGTIKSWGTLGVLPSSFQFFSYFVIGAREMVVTSAEELLGAVEMGNALRHTGATGMNEHSSRSNVILTLQVHIRSYSNKNPSLKTVRSSKLCLVDLAGSERASKTGNTGAQFKESALINTGLLALGNVIRALSDRGRSRRGNGCSSPHVPYRDAKITRLLRDSLGGNAHTVMVACVSPSHHFIAETLNVLQFASKARHIRNYPKRLNQDTAAQYLFLAKEAAYLLADMFKAFPSVMFTQRLQEWQERLAAVSQSHHTSSIDCSEGAGDLQLHVTALNLREELRQCQVKRKKGIGLVTFKVCMCILNKEHSRILTEQLVSQQILIDRLRSSLVAVRGMTPGSTEEAMPSGNSCTRPQSVPLITHSLLHRPSRKIHSSPPTYSLERVMTAFRMRGHLLLAEIEEKDEVYCPFITQQAKSKERIQNNHEEETKEKDAGMERSSCRKEFRRANIVERRIHELMVSMRLKEELIKELDKTGELTWFHVAVCREMEQKLHGSSWPEEEEERAIHKRAELQELGEELKRKVEVLQHRETCVQQKNKLQIKMLQSSQALSRDLLQVSVQLESVEEQLQSQSSARKTRMVTVRELEKERDMLKMKRDTLEAQLRDNRVLSVEEEHSLLQLEEAVEVLDAALEFKNNAIQERQNHLFVGNSPLLESKDTEPAQHCDITRKLKKLSLPEAIELLIKYFNKVVCLREAERRLHMQCEELELHVSEQEAALREMEAAMQRFALDADRRLTLQHRDHQNNVRLLLQELKEGMSRETQQAIQVRVQHLEKELFFYKSSSRQLKKKLKELLSDAPHNDNQSSHTQESRERQGTHLPFSVNEPKTHCEEEGETTHISTTYTKIYTEEIESKPVKPSLSVVQALPKTKFSEHSQALTLSYERYRRGQPEVSLEMTPVKLCRRELREISAADLQLLGAATRRHQSVVNSSSESMMEDSIEVPRNT
uniref:Kinesin family member 27 n=1 Tax=Xiphophorus couchianus TaxID=32473 RepID=A0A3B5L2W1_9TELE